LPPQLSTSSLARLVRGLDAVLLTGGGDMDPACFGEAPHPTLYDVAPSRDALETSVTHMALEKKTPLLAICRGIQVLNVALGGTLHQDVARSPARRSSTARRRRALRRHTRSAALPAAASPRCSASMTSRSTASIIR